MANEQNLRPFVKGDPRRIDRPKGSPNRKTILNYFLFDTDISDLGILDSLTNKPAWVDKAKPKTLYEMMVLAQSIKAISGDTKAFNALNHALGDEILTEQAVNVVHIFKPEKIETLDEYNTEAEKLRTRTRQTVEAEVIDEHMESPAGPSDLSTTSTG